MEKSYGNDYWNSILINKITNNEDELQARFVKHLTDHLKQNETIKQGFDLVNTDPKNWWSITLPIPEVLLKYKLEIKTSKLHCYSALIDELQIDDIMQELKALGPFEKTDDPQHETSILALYREIVWSIPYVFRLLGLQVTRLDQHFIINEKLVDKLARAIHARYQDMMKKKQTEAKETNLYDQLYLAPASKEYIEKTFDQLPENIRLSNLDNAYHIPSKLMAIGLGIDKSTSDDARLLYLSNSDVETLAMVEHLRWCWEKRLNGFIYGPVRDDAKKIHNCLVPYDQLTEFEKEKDRVLVRLIPPLLKDVGFETFALQTGDQVNLDFASKNRTKISQLKFKIEKLQNHINQEINDKRRNFGPEILEILSELNEDAAEISGAFSSAVSVQRTYLPSPILFRECLPDSFLLYKPKDGVGGDFYFVARKFGAVIWVCADCTGHGIGAGLLTAICYNYIDQAVNYQNLTDPSAIINHVMPRVETLMRRTDGNLENKSGMELAICTWYPQANMVFYSGLNRPLYIVSDNRLAEFEATRYRESFDSIASNLKTEIIPVKNNDAIYLTSDGFIDQFGGTRDKLGERFKNKRFKDLLLEIQDQNMAQQRETLNQTIEKWRQDANQDQTDDILVIGVKF